MQPWRSSHKSPYLVAEARCQQNLTSDAEPTATAVLREFLHRLTKVTVVPESELVGRRSKRKREGKKHV